MQPPPGEREETRVRKREKTLYKNARCFIVFLANRHMREGIESFHTKRWVNGGTPKRWKRKMIFGLENPNLRLMNARINWSVVGPNRRQVQKTWKSERRKSSCQLAKQQSQWRSTSSRFSHQI
ncbi:hypothetical protein NPIL_60351 [Nephila pilipes]|uniref:Uncharacterized protein n=1 Tax=Nephila pilipes TaxID=299642 RepID=A0A8X6TKK2_NEPPI|nr:hypothetical protein NPIL_60351 [Nephila pilipes]